MIEVRKTQIDQVSANVGSPIYTYSTHPDSDLLILLAKIADFIHLTEFAKFDTPSESDGIKARSLLDEIAAHRKCLLEKLGL